MPGHSAAQGPEGLTDMVSESPVTASLSIKTKEEINYLAAPGNPSIKFWQPLVHGVYDSRPTKTRALMSKGPPHDQ